MPLSTVQVSSVVDILQNQAKCKTPSYMYLQDMETQSDFTSEDDFSQAALENCVIFLKRCYEQNEAVEDGLVTEHVLPVCLFHTALMYHTEFAKDILGRLNDKEAKFVLTAIVNYKQSCEKASVHTFTSDDQKDIQELGLYLFAKDGSSRQLARNLTEYELPLGFVMSSGNPDLLKLVLERGANVMQSDHAGNTIVHLLVDLSTRQPQKAVQMYNYLMQEITNADLKKGLVTQINAQGKAPVEVAAEEILPEMLYALFNTVGVYKFPLRDYGTYRYVAFDVTMDERDKRLSGNTVLHLLSAITEEQLIRVHNFKLLEKEPFHTWINEKYSVNRTVTRVWMGLSCTFVVLYLTSLFWYRESRDSFAFNLAVIVLGSCIILQEIFGTYWMLPFYKVMSRRIRKGLYPVAFSIGYRMFQVFFFTSATAAHLIAIIGPDCSNSFHVGFMMLVDAGTVFYAFMGLMFFTQLNKSMGHYLTVLEKMLTSTISFITLGFFYFVGFATTFYIYHIPDYCPQHAAGINVSGVNSTDLDQVNFTEQNFASFWSSQYETLLLILSVTAPKDWYFTSSNNPVITTWVYVGSLVLNTLILLNLLVAIMNQRVVEMCQHKDTIQKIQHLSIYMFVEEKALLNEKICQLLRIPLLMKIDKMNIYHSNNKVYLHTTEPSTLC